LSCHLCFLISCYSLVFCLLSFDCSFCLTTWYLYILYLSNLVSQYLRENKIKTNRQNKTNYLYEKETNQESFDKLLIITYICIRMGNIIFKLFNRCAMCFSLLHKSSPARLHNRFLRKYEPVPQTLFENLHNIRYLIILKCCKLLKMFALIPFTHPLHVHVLTSIHDHCFPFVNM